MEVIKKCISEAARFLEREVAAVDARGLIFASNRAEIVGNCDKDALALSAANEGYFAVRAGRSYARLDMDDRNSTIIYVEGTDTAAKEILELLSQWLRSALLERNTDDERRNFLKNVLLENELPGDIPLKARDFKLVYAQPRQVILIRLESPPEVNPINLVNEALGNNHDHYVLAFDEENIVVLLRYEAIEAGGDNDISNRVFEHFKRYAGCQLHIGVGLVANTLKDAAKSYRQAALALTVGRIFEEATDIMRYDRLGLGRLIYQLPPTLCEMFLAEVFEPDTYEQLDHETLLTIEKFFENNLNGSETSRQLFIHRNTLVYRLDKVQKITNLDLRSFDDAVLFKLAAMVRQYLESLRRLQQSKLPPK